MHALHILAIIFGFPISGVGIALVVRSGKLNNGASLEERRIRLIASMNGLVKTSKIMRSISATKCGGDRILN